jgi:capsule polysaccharide export protein KpsE/RkpR
LALFIKPRLADSALYPHRLESVAIVFLAAAAVWFIGLMVAYAVRDHLI